MSTKSELYLGLMKEKLKLQEDVSRLETSNSVFANDPRAAIAAKQEQIKSIDEELARLAPGETVESKAVPQIVPIVWQGHKVEFASAIVDLFEKDHIRANSPTDALNQAAPHFVGKDGKAFKPKSLWQNLKNKQDSRKRP
jgi:hypothetical protein